MKKIIVMLLIVLMAGSLVYANGSGEKEDTIKIGVVSMLTGNYAEMGQRMWLAAETLADYINANGGVLGKQIQLISFDSGSDQQTCITGVQKAVNTEGLSCLIGQSMSAWLLGYSEIIKEAQLPHVFTGNSQSCVNINEYVYLNRMTDMVSTELAAKRLVQEYGCKKPAVIYMTNASGQSQYEAFISGVQKYGGEIAIAVGYETGATSDFTPHIMQILSSNSDGLLVVGGADAESSLIMNTLYSYGYDKPIECVSSMFSQVVIDTSEKGALDGVFGIAEYNPNDDTEASKLFKDCLAANEKYQSKFGDPSWLEAAYWDQLLIVVEAMKLTGSSDPASVQEGIHKLNNLQGVITSYTYTGDSCLADYVWTSEFVDGSIAIADKVYRDK